jgi:hypothetical protein
MFETNILVGERHETPVPTKQFVKLKNFDTPVFIVNFHHKESYLNLFFVNFV